MHMLANIFFVNFKQFDFFYSAVLDYIWGGGGGVTYRVASVIYHSKLFICYNK